MALIVARRGALSGFGPRTSRHAFSIAAAPAQPRTTVAEFGLRCPAVSRLWRPARTSRPLLRLDVDHSVRGAWIRQSLYDLVAGSMIDHDEPRARRALIRSESVLAIRCRPLMAAGRCAGVGRSEIDELHGEGLRVHHRKLRWRGTQADRQQLFIG